jgi:hypothetical protein
MAKQVFDNTVQEMTRDGLGKPGVERSYSGVKDVFVYFIGTANRRGFFGRRLFIANACYSFSRVYEAEEGGEVHDKINEKNFDRSLETLVRG